jgi:hypothetical protein
MCTALAQRAQITVFEPDNLCSLGQRLLLGESWWQTIYIRRGILPFATVVFYLAQSKISYHLQYWMIISTDYVVRTHSHIILVLVLSLRGGE